MVGAARTLPHLLVDVVGAKILALCAAVVHGVALANGEARVAAPQVIGIRVLDEPTGGVEGASFLALLQGEFALGALAPGALLALRE